jgi:hypothetical protein
MTSLTRPTRGALTPARVVVHYAGHFHPHSYLTLWVGNTGNEQVGGSLARLGL